MSHYLFRRLLELIPVFLFVTLITFTLMHLAPGGPWDRQRTLPPTVRANLNAYYALDQPLPVQFGRYLLGLLHGSRISLGVATLAQLLVLLIGMPIGLIAGSGGRWRDDILMRGTDIIYAFPDLLFVIVMLSVLGRNVFYVPMAMGLISWTTLARLVRAQVLSLRTCDFVLAAEVIGVPPWQIVLRHILPHMLTPIIVTVTLGVPQFILLEATLSFIGIGAPPPMPSWGLMVNEGFTAIFSYPHLVVIPGSAIALTMLSCTFIGDGLRDALDPRQE